MRRHRRYAGRFHNRAERQDFVPVKHVHIRGAREHNLKNIDVRIPRDSLVIVSGVSGSGKSSLAFDTIYAEGKRRYVESLSSYARQFLGQMDKPDLDHIEGLSPAISIEQKTTNRNPRSTVGTITEIYDHLRLLYARIGIPHDPDTGQPVRKQSLDEIVDRICSEEEGLRIMILAPVVRGRKGAHRRVFEDAERGGFTRVRVDGSVVRLDEGFGLDKNRTHDIEIVVDRLRLRSDSRKRVAQSVETALELGSGSVFVVMMSEEGQERVEQFSENYAYENTALSVPDLEPKLFSFNSPAGACPECDGLGVKLTFDPDKIVPDPSLSFNDGGLAPYSPSSSWHRSRFESLADHYGFSLDTPIAELDKDARSVLFEGAEEDVAVSVENEKANSRFEYQMAFPGIYADLKRRYRESSSDGVREWLESFMSRTPCPACNGRRLKAEARWVLVGGFGIQELSALSITACRAFFSDLELSETEQRISEEILREIRARLDFLISVGLGYLSLDRAVSTLSGGESQRIRLATQIGSSLMGVLYILDEPTIGLHQRDNARLLETLYRLRDLGNTLIVVEHDEQTIRNADYIIDLGPGAGVHGGKIVAEGTLDEILSNPESPTGAYLSGRVRIEPRVARRSGPGNMLRMEGCRSNNLSNITVDIPLGVLTAVTGVSGSGKSTFTTGTLYPALAARLHGRAIEQGQYDTISGTEHLDKVIIIDQSPIGRTPRSNPATYVGLYTTIRELFSSLPESRARGYKPGRFSFNVKGGRCEHCQGAGTITIEMHFLSDVYVACDVCGGKRFNRETLEVHYKGRSIYDVLELTVEEALEVFHAVPAARRKLQTLADVGLEYIKLGQSALTLSGGEAQRVKLALELSKRSTGRTIYFLDEPTTGLHFADVHRLMDVLQLLVNEGNTIVLIEHNLDVIAQCDYVVDLGPEGGENGGTVVVAGTPEDVASCDGSHTGRFLRDLVGRSEVS